MVGVDEGLVHYSVDYKLVGNSRDDRVERLVENKVDNKT